MKILIQVKASVLFLFLLWVPFLWFPFQAVYWSEDSCTGRSCLLTPLVIPHLSSSASRFFWYLFFTGSCVIEAGACSASQIQLGVCLLFGGSWSVHVLHEVIQQLLHGLGPSVSALSHSTYLVDWQSSGFQALLGVWFWFEPTSILCETWQKSPVSLTRAWILSLTHFNPFWASKSHFLPFIAAVNFFEMWEETQFSLGCESGSWERMMGEPAS